MAEYIEREAAKKAIFDYILEDTVSKHQSSELCRASRMGAEGAMYELDYVPAADVVDVRHGEWVHEGKPVHCNQCGFSPRYSLANNDGYSNCDYCPNCGAKMDGKDGAE